MDPDSQFDVGPILARFAASVQVRLWRRAELHYLGKGLGHGVCTRGLVAFLEGLRRKGLTEEASALRLAATASFWPGDRVGAAYPSADTSCPRCGAAVESATHRFWECPWISTLDADGDQARLGLAACLTSIAAVDEAEETLGVWCRGLVPLAWVEGVPRPPEKATWTLLGLQAPWRPGPADGGVLDVYTDASGGPHPSHSVLLRAAWAVVLLDRRRRAEGHALGPASALAGPLTGDLQSVPLAELIAVLMALRMSARAAPLVIHCDCQYVCSGVQQLLDGASPPTKKYAATWAAIARAIEARSAHTAIQKVKAHLSDLQLYACSLEEWRHAFGNQLADAFAKEAATAAEVEPGIARAQLALEARCQQVWRRLATVGAAVHRDPRSARPTMRPPGRREEAEQPAGLEDKELGPPSARAPAFSGRPSGARLAGFAAPALLRQAAAMPQAQQLGAQGCLAGLAGLGMRFAYWSAGQATTPRPGRPGPEGARAFG